MPQFYYKALKPNGSSATGFITADKAGEARKMLRSRQLMLLEMQEGAEKNTGLHLSEEQLVHFTQQLAHMLGAGVPLYESLHALEDQYRGETYQPLILALCDAIKRGSSFSDALQLCPHVFSPFYISLIQAGEAAGNLDETLSHLAAILEKNLKQKKKIVSALMYPAMLAAFSIVVLLSLMAFVIPSIESLFEDRPLNGMTAFVISLSHLLTQYWVVYIPLFALTCIGLYTAYKSHKGRRLWDRWLLKLPIVGKLIIQISVTRFCQTLATLQGGGVSLMRSIRIARNTVSNQEMTESLAKVEELLGQGESLTKGLSQCQWLPRLVQRMVSTGENNGRLNVMLLSIAQMYESESEKTLTRLTTLLQPLILIIMGVFVGFVMMAVLLPLTDISALKL